MSHTNSTTNYSLPQFVTTDKPAWLTDVNNAYAAIDTGMHNAQTKANTADTNASQALLDASAAASAASTADAKGSGAVASIADSFQTTETYAVGDLVIYNNLLYICTTAVSTPGAWTGNTNWSRATLEGYVNDRTGADIKLNGNVGAPSVENAIAGKANSATSLSGYGITDAYTKSEADTLLGNKLDTSIRKSQYSGNFVGLVTSGHCWMFTGMRVSTDGAFMYIIHNHNGTMHVKTIVQDSGFSIITNNQGTVAISYSNSTDNIMACAYQIY